MSNRRFKKFFYRCPVEKDQKIYGHYGVIQSGQAHKKTCPKENKRYDIDKPENREHNNPYTGPVFDAVKMMQNKENKYNDLPVEEQLGGKRFPVVDKEYC